MASAYKYGELLSRVQKENLHWAINNLSSRLFGGNVVSPGVVETTNERRCCSKLQQKARADPSFISKSAFLLLLIVCVIFVVSESAYLHERLDWIQHQSDLVAQRTGTAQTLLANTNSLQVQLKEFQFTQARVFHQKTEESLSMLLSTLSTVLNRPCASSPTTTAAVPTTQLALPNPGASASVTADMSGKDKLNAAGVSAAWSWSARALVFDQPNFKGDVLAITTQIDFKQEHEWNDRVMSVWVQPGCTLRAFKHSIREHHSSNPKVDLVGSHSVLDATFARELSSFQLFC